MRTASGSWVRWLAVVSAVYLSGAIPVAYAVGTFFDQDIGSGDDALLLISGFYQAEKPYPPAENDFHRTRTFRWFANSWSMHLPVFAGRDTLVTLELWTERRITLTVEGAKPVSFEGGGDDDVEIRFCIPAAICGNRDWLTLSAELTPPFELPEGLRDRRVRAGALSRVRSEAVSLVPDGVSTVKPDVSGLSSPEYVINVGGPVDGAVLTDGAYSAEGFNARSRHIFYRSCTFRWLSNRWSATLPVFPGRHNEVVFRGMGRGGLVKVEGRSLILLPPGGADQSTTLVLPADLVGDREWVAVAVRAMPAYLPRPGSSETRELALALDWIRVAPIDSLEDGIMESQTVPIEPEADLPLTHRLRGTEARPLHTDIEAYVTQARIMRCNVMTIGPMNGRHFTAFPTENGTPADDMQPDFIPNQIRALHEQGIAAIGWLPFNVQDLRRPDQCEAAEKHPEWRMQFIDWDERPSDGKVGMCVVSSPWREMHGGILKEAAAQGLDGVFFDGFYLGGIPHPLAAGCVCPYCTARFKQETGLDTPARVDWTDPAFKRWVRWRNHKLIETALYFQDRMREVNPDLWITCNYNMWPFGSKDWDTGIPLWATESFGTSQHAYTGRADMEWVMLGFKSRLSHDISPTHSDIWRTGRPAFKYAGTKEDIERHELTMRTFMLSGLTYGTTPWHGGHLSPPEMGVRVHLEVKKRERFFSQREFRHVGVLLSQNTHDFYGHIPGTSNLESYRDGILGAWLLLTENHVPFRFVFDNQLEAGELDGLKILFLPNAACLSVRAAEAVAAFAAAGGRVVTTGETGEFDEWGVKRNSLLLAGIEGVAALEGTPCLTWLRTRDAGAEQAVLSSLAAIPSPLTLEAPRSLAMNACWSPDGAELWIHLLNVSAFYPGGDTGFRGVGEEPVYAGAVATDAALVTGGAAQRVNRPAEDVRLVVSLPVETARLTIAPEALVEESAGHYRIRTVDVHDTLVLELK